MAERPVSSRPMTPELRSIQQHLVKHLGRPSTLFQLRPRAGASTSITDLTIASFRGKRVAYATAGAFRHRMRDGRRIEALVMTHALHRESRTQAIQDFLASFVLQPETAARTIRYGDIVQAPALGREWAIENVLVSPPVVLPASFKQTALNENDRVDWCWLVPIHSDEARYALRKGTARLMQTFAQQKTDLTNLSRPAIRLRAGSGVRRGAIVSPTTA